MKQFWKLNPARLLHIRAYLVSVALQTEQIELGVKFKIKEL